LPDLSDKATNHKILGFLQRLVEQNISGVTVSFLLTLVLVTLYCGIISTFADMRHQKQIKNILKNKIFDYPAPQQGQSSQQGTAPQPQQPFQNR